MRNLYIKLALICVLSTTSFAVYGVPDPATLGGTISPAPAIWPRTNPETYETFTFQINNNGTSTSHLSVKFTVSLSQLDFGETFNPAIHITQLAGTTPFTFTYNPLIKVLTGTLNGTFSQFAGNTFRINRLIVQAASPQPQNNIGAIVNITSPGAQNSSRTNDVTDSYTYTVSELTISGTVFNDANGTKDSLVNGAPTNTIGSNTLYANLVNPTTGLVVASIPVNPDGTYSFGPANGVQPNTNYHIVVTNGLQTTGTAPVTTLSGAVNTAEGMTGTGDGNPNGITSVAVGNTPVNGINFGIDRIPLANNKTYNVPYEAFSPSPPAGYPNINSSGNRYFTISTSSTELTGYNGLGGALSGSDAEDCPTSLATPYPCNTGSTFVLKSISPGTVLYYNYGGAAGVQQVPLNGKIPNYDPSKLVIYAHEGTGMITSPVSFTYSLEDAAGVQSPPASYMILTESTLPVELLYFTATTNDCDIILNWATASELNNDYFTIYRSVDFYHWEKVTKTPGHGTVDYRNDYSYIDHFAYSGTLYYRLEQTDYNGTTEQLPVVLTELNCTGLSTKVYPNPANNVIYIETSPLPENQPVDIVMNDGLGRVLRTVRTTESITKMDVSDLPSENYYIRIYNENKLIDVVKIVVIK